MAILTSQRKTDINANYNLGNVWDGLSQAEKNKIYETVDGIWSSLNWKEGQDPNTNTALATKLESVLAIHIKELADTGGSLEAQFPNTVRVLLASYLNVSPVEGSGDLAAQKELLDKQREIELAKLQDFKTRADLRAARALQFDKSTANSIVRATAFEDEDTETESGGGSSGGVDLSEIADWAEEGNTDPIPTTKLTLAPGGGGGGLSVAQVQSIVQTDVADWAETGNTDTIPDSKIPSNVLRDFTTAPFAQPGSGEDIPEDQIPDDIARDDEIEDWAKTGNTDPIPTTKLSLAPGGGGGGLNLAQVQSIVSTGVEDWAEPGSGVLIPEEKLVNAPGGSGGLSESEVDARVSAGVADWAEQDNNSDIPEDKLPQGALLQEQVFSQDGSVTVSQLPDGNGVDLSADFSETGATIKTKLEALLGTNRLDASAIKNLPEAGGGEAEDSSLVFEQVGSTWGQNDLSSPNNNEYFDTQISLPSSTEAHYLLIKNQNNRIIFSGLFKLSNLLSGTVDSGVYPSGGSDVPSSTNGIRFFSSGSNIFTYLSKTTGGNYAIGSAGGVAITFQVFKVLAPAGGGGGGVDTDAVDERIEATVNNWARRSQTTEKIPLSKIPDLPGSKITTGTIGTERIPDLPVSKITNLNTTIDNSVSTEVNTVINARIWTGTQAQYDLLSPDSNSLYFIVD